MKWPGMLNRRSLSSVAGLCVVLVLALFAYSHPGQRRPPSTDAVIPARLASRGEPISRLVTPRQQPISVDSKLHLPSAVTADDLVSVLCGALPLWNPPSVPSAFHELRLWGRHCAFTKEMLGVERSGDFLVTTLLNDSACVASTASPGGHYLLDSPYGIRVILAGTLDAVEYRAEAHYGQLLKVMGQVGVPSTTPVSTSSGRVGNLEDVYQDTILRFSLEQELEFIGLALAYWHPPQKAWSNQFGVQFDFDRLLLALIANPFGKGACGGCHLPYTVVTILRVDEECPILSAEVRVRAREWLAALSHWLGHNQSPQGGWDKSWAQAEQIKFVYGDDRLDRITITGHHLEWMALVSDEQFRPSEPTIRRAVEALRRDVESLPALEHRSFKSLLPVSHGARALALLLGADPFSVWREYWKAGRIRRTEQGFALQEPPR